MSADLRTATHRAANIIRTAECIALINSRTTAGKRNALHPVRPPPSGNIDRPTTCERYRLSLPILVVVVQLPYLFQTYASNAFHSSRRDLSCLQTSSQWFFFSAELMRARSYISIPWRLCIFFYFVVTECANFQFVITLPISLSSLDFAHQLSSTVWSTHIC